jgi:hypothetical protein
MGFRIGSLCTRFVSMSQTLLAALREDRHEVIRPEDLQIRTPGIRGDRGPSSLSWAILTGASRSGLTMARAEPATRPEELRSAGGAAAHRPVGV